MAVQLPYLATRWQLNPPTQATQPANPGNSTRQPGQLTGAGRGSGPVDRDLVLEAGEAVEPGVLAGVADVDDEERLPATVREELRVDPVLVEARHRAGGEAGGADGEDEGAHGEGGGELAGAVAGGL